MAAVVATLEVLHRTPIRIRLAVTPATQGLVQDLVTEARSIAGVKRAEPGASGRNLVLRYRPDRVAERTVLMRLALALTARGEFERVQIIQQRTDPGLDKQALGAGMSAGLAAAANALMPGSGLAGVAGWTAVGMTLFSVGGDVLKGLSEGRPRPEGLSLLYLLSNLQSAGRAQGALLTWALYHGPRLAERLSGSRADGVEIRPVQVPGGVGDDDGKHYEVVTRPIAAKGPFDGQVLTPASLIAAGLGYLTFALKQGWGSSGSR